MNMPTILYEDSTVLVIDKPAGLLVHRDGRSTEATLADWVLAEYPEMNNVGESWERDDGTVIPRPGIVHRLDRDTSGVMVLAKTPVMFTHLKQAFMDRIVEKTYRAFVYGILKDDEGVIERPIGKSRKDVRMWSAQRGARGKMRDAITHFSVLKRGREASYVELKPHTGRTHQLRVHLKAINHPIVCDALYAPKQKCVLGFSRLALHAYTLSFEDRAGKTHTIAAPLPQDFEHALALFD